jgi:hypothetical protein
VAARARRASPPVPADAAEAAALFRSLTAASPVAVLAADATDAGQVRDLLQGPGWSW